MIGLLRSLALLTAGLCTAVLVATPSPMTATAWSATSPRATSPSGAGSGTDSSAGEVQELTLAADMLFALDKADLSAKAGAVITDTAARIRASGATSITVTGYTDSQGSDSYNLDLSRRRAQAVKAALVRELGPSITITARGLGESAPIADNATPKGQALNRRVEIGLG
jgi:outer membrane protein OmpA-like peptidoglycan-associated protein